MSSLAISQTLGCLCLFGAFLLALYYLYRAGYRRGYEYGRKETEEWIAQQGAEVDRTREAIWREEA